MEEFRELRILRISFYINASHSTPVGGENAPKLVCQPLDPKVEEQETGTQL